MGLTFAQNCNFQINGLVKDAGNDEALEFVNVYVEETSSGASTDSIGAFIITDLCPGHLHLVISHIGCTTQFVHIDLVSDTTLMLYMDHSKHHLADIVIKGKASETTLQNTEVINKNTITDNSDLDIANQLTKISGISALKSGSGVAKPIIHGLFGNRITIMNNGIPQAGQQWGNDHSPEIDPLSANEIKVVKGTAALAHNGSNLGGVVFVEASKINNEPHLHGAVNYFFESNGLGNGLHFNMNQYYENFGWRVNGTIKKRGDQKTANYFLTNTGAQQANLAFQLEKVVDDKWFLNLYGSTFNTTIGILRGAHIGNLTDLKNAINRDVPFFTKDDFSYATEAPRQQVNHHLLKLKSKYFFTTKSWLTITLAGQLNNRKEFDVRRSGRSDIPSLSLQQFGWFAEAKYEHQLDSNFNFDAGLQLNVINNNNVPGTGILPLIPNYYAYETGVFALLDKTFANAKLEIGLRYDNVLQNVAGIKAGSSQEIFRATNKFNNFSGAFGWKQQLTENITASFNAGYATRNPAINELYSAGLHQGVSGIEEGNENLKVEQSFKTTLSLNANIYEFINLEALLYYQNIDNYIYLQPQDEFRLTIRGAFPVFKYEQTNAQIYGVDFSTQLKLSESLKATFTYSFIKGDDLSQSLPLVYMPPNNLIAAIEYEFFKPLKIFTKQLENVTLTIEDQYTFEQSNYVEGQDFLAPPAAYNLLGLKAAADLQVNKTRWHFTLKADNLLNTNYRDFLNRQRYYANELGRNFVLGASFKF